MYNDLYLKAMIEPLMFRDKVKTYLLEQLKTGKLKIGKTINLAAIAREMGMSVTPVREALSQMEHAHIIKSIPNRGFVIQYLGAEEAQHLYKTVAQLEVMALESTLFLPEHLKELRCYLEINGANTTKSRLEFHELLLKSCGNPILIQILNDLKVRLFFYEQMLPEDTLADNQMESQNRAILDAIEENNVPTAALILKMHWLAALERVQNQFSVD